VKHRSPLVTLATVFVAFAIMFTVNMLSGSPGKSSTGTADPPVASASVSASSGSPQPTETAVVIVIEDGSQVGVQITGTGLAAAVQLDPENPEVTVEGVNLGAKLVSGDEDL
jgi:hypothetical protein